MKNHKFSYDVSTITGFSDEVGGMLLSQSLVGATTPQYSNVRLGIKGSQSINILTSDLAVQDGDCGWSQSGTTTFTQVELTTCAKRVNESLCPTTLYDTYQSMLLAPGQTEQSVPFEQAIADLKVKQVQEYIESKLWTSTIAAGDCFNGFSSLIVTGATGVANAAGTAFSSTAAYGTAGNPITEVDGLINALSDDAMAKDDLVVYMSYAYFRMYVQALTKENFFKDYIKDANITGNMIAIHPNSNVTVVPTKGLNGSNKVVIGSKEYFVVGFDLLSDHESFDIWWSRDNDEVRFRANFNYGAAIPNFGAGKNYFATNNL